MGLQGDDENDENAEVQNKVTSSAVISGISTL